MNEVATSRSFQEKMFERIRDQMGNLLTDDDLKRIVEASVEKAFFEPFKGHDGWRETQNESVFIKLVRNELESRVGKAIDNYLKEHGDIISKAINEALSKGIYRLVVGHFEMLMSGAFANFRQNLINQGLLNL